jgi:hypothetical protein
VPETFSGSLTVRQWQYIDAGLDNDRALAYQNEGSSPETALVESIREAGWEQLSAPSGDWLPETDVVEISLTRLQWMRVQSHVEEWKLKHDMTGRLPDLEAQITPRIRDIVDSLNPGKS